MWGIYAIVSLVCVWQGMRNLPHIRVHGDRYGNVTGLILCWTTAVLGFFHALYELTQ